LYAESVSGPMHISSIYVLEGELSHGEVLDHFAERIHLVPSYRRKIAQIPFSLSHPKWVDDPDFELEHHVRHHELPPESTLQDGIDAAATLNEPMLDRSRPLWLVYVITGVPDRTLLLQMTHHAMIDGASGVELTTILYDFEPDKREVEPAEDEWHPGRSPTTAELFGEALQENLAKLSTARPGDVFPNSEKQQELARRAMQVFNNFAARPAITAPFNAAPVSPKRRVRYVKKSFGEIREIRRALGGTINDLVLTVVSEAVARYLRVHGEPAENQHMRIMCPVNVRTEDQKGGLGNQVSAIFPMLPAWPMRVRSRLAVVCAEMERIKDNEEAQAMTLASESGANVWPLAMAPTQLVGTPFDPTAAAARMPMPVPAATGWRPPNVGINFICTNVPGVQVPQYLAGHKVLETIGLLILSGNVGFSVTILSYNKELFFSFICEPRLLPDLETISDEVDKAFDELLSEAREHTSQLTGTKE
jgi:WS/DGAT/MGAT family acyltransferase